MRLFLFFILSIFIPVQLSANPFPALYDVAGVASDDVLNIRAEPNAQAEKIGALSYAQTQVEVVATSDDHKWGLVNSGEGAGWVAMAYLKRWPGQEWGQFQMPHSCFGTEPFWNLTGLQDDQITLAEMSGATYTYRVTVGMGAIARHDVSWLVGEAADRKIHITYRQESCHDGMSDRAYGYAVDLFAQTNSDGPLALSGCCSLTQ